MVSMVDKSQIPVGYKQTEVGVIPEDWKASKLSDFVKSLEAGVSVNSIEAMDVFSHGKSVLKTSCISGGYFYPSEGKGIVPNDLTRAKLNPKRGSIIISRMNTPDLVGEVGYVDKDYFELFLPDRLWQTKYTNEEKVDGRWLAFVLSYPEVAKKIKEVATGTSNSMKNISKGSLLAIQFPSPKIKEQTAIANALSDVDALIAALEELIDKKTAIKISAMQQLLTGKKRLPPFDQLHTSYKKTELGEIPEDWQVFPFFSMVEIAQGQVDPRVEPFKSMILVGPKHVESSTGKLLFTETAFEQGAISGKYIFNKGDVVYGKINPYLMKATLATFSGLCSADMYPLRPLSNLFPRYLLALILGEPFTKYAVSVSSRSGMPKINRQEFSEYKFIAPTSIDEQTAIANVLSDMDTELDALQLRLAKTQQLKQGMMQELLTGKTRLI